MKLFADLIRKLDSTNKTNLKVEALRDYFLKATDSDKVWAIAILSHKRPPRPVNTTLMRQYAAEIANIPLWLFEESYHIVGDLAETIALVIPDQNGSTDKSLSTFLQEIIELKSQADEEKRRYLQANWQQLDYYSRFVFTKLLTGSFRIGVSQKLMTRALAQATDIDEDILAYKLMGNWEPSKISFEELVLETNKAASFSKPFPFYLAYAIEGKPQDLGNIEDYALEHKWDGIRGQLIVRNGEHFVWTRGEELVTDKYPEFENLVDCIPEGTVLDGEILPWVNEGIGRFSDLQKRIGRKNITNKLLNKIGVIFKAYDLLEYQGKDVRDKSFKDRRELLDQILSQCTSPYLHKSELIMAESWEAATEERARAREMKSEGLMLKRLDSPYGVGRKKGDWWKWKVDPLTIDGVLTFAMRGHGRRTNLFTDYTFGVWDRSTDPPQLVTFAKAYSGLTDAEFRQVDAFIKRNTLERFGPVRSVEPKLVFEIAFEGIAPSGRHKSGVAVRFPRIFRWRKDKTPDDANSLDDLQNLLSVYQES